MTCVSYRHSHGPPPPLSSLSLIPPSSATFHCTARCRRTLSPWYNDDFVFTLQDRRDEISLAVFDTSSGGSSSHSSSNDVRQASNLNATASSDHASASSKDSKAKLVGAVYLPLASLMPNGEVIDRWFDLSLPSLPAPVITTAQNGRIGGSELRAYCADAVEPTDALIEVAAIDHAAAANVDLTAPADDPPPLTASSPVGRIRVKAFLSYDDHSSNSVNSNSSNSHNVDSRAPTMTAFPESLRQLTMQFITWNVGNKPLQADLSPLFPQPSPPSTPPSLPSSTSSTTLSPLLMPDIVAVALQEATFDAGESAAARDFSGQATLGSTNDEQSIIAEFTKLLPNAYCRLHAAALWQTRLLLWAKAELLPQIKGLTVDTVATGLGGVMKNKGGIVCSLRVRDTHIGIIAAHLAAHTDRVKQRHRDLATIVKSVGFPFVMQRHTSSATNDASHLSTTTSSNHNHSSTVLADFHSFFHASFICGDLNYRLEYPPGSTARKPEPFAFQQVVDMVRSKAWSALLRYDQLRSAIADGVTLPGYDEPIINFPPTFKVKHHVTLAYDSHRLPSYTDRVLYRSVWKEEKRQDADGTAEAAAKRSRPRTHTGVEAVSMFSPLALMSSDHKPVSAMFSVPVFWLASKHDTARGKASLVCQRATFEAGQALKHRDAAYVVEMRAAFLHEPIVVALQPQRTAIASNANVTSADLPIPIAYNNPARIRRERVLLRLFKVPSSSAGLIAPAISGNASPLAMGCAVLAEAAAAHRTSALHSSTEALPFTISTPLADGDGALSMTIRIDVALEIERIDDVAAKATAAITTLSRVPSKASTTAVAAIKTNAPPATVKHRSALVARTQGATSIPCNSAVRNSIETPSLSFTAKSIATRPAVKPSSAPVNTVVASLAPSTLVALLLLLVRSEQLYVASLNVLVRKYYVPLLNEALQQDKLADTSSSQRNAALSAPSVPSCRRGYFSSSRSSLLPKPSATSRIALLSPSYVSGEHEEDSTIAYALRMKPSEIVHSVFGDIALLVSAHQHHLPSLLEAVRALMTNISPSPRDVMHALSAVRQWLSGIMPLLSLYRAAPRPDMLANANAELSHLLARIEQIDSAQRAIDAAPLSCATLLALPSQRIDFYRFFVSEVIEQQRVQYGRLSLHLQQIDMQIGAFQRWYMSLGQELSVVHGIDQWSPTLEQSDVDTLSHDRPATPELPSQHRRLRPPVAASTTRPQATPLRLTTAAVVRPYTARFNPLGTAIGCRPATSYGRDDEDGGYDDSLLLYSRGSTADREDERQAKLITPFIIERIRLQLQTLLPLDGFHRHIPLLRTACDAVLVDVARAERTPLSPPPATALTTDDLRLFHISRRPTVRRLVPSLRHTAVSQERLFASIVASCSRHGIGRSSESTRHWSLVLPSSFRSHAAARAAIALIDSANGLTDGVIDNVDASREGRAMPPLATSAPMPVNVSRLTTSAGSSAVLKASTLSRAQSSESYEEDSFDALSDDDVDDDAILSPVAASAATAASASRAHGELQFEDSDNEEIMSVASEQLNLLLQRTAKAQQHVQQRQRGQQVPQQPQQLRQQPVVPSRMNQRLQK